MHELKSIITIEAELSFWRQSLEIRYILKELEFRYCPNIENHGYIWSKTIDLFWQNKNQFLNITSPLLYMTNCHLMILTKHIFYNDIFSWKKFWKNSSKCVRFMSNQVKKHTLRPFKNMYGWMKNSAFWF